MGFPMTDVLGIIGYYSKDERKNAFRIRGIGPTYDALWKWVNDPGRTAYDVLDDFPWSHIAFDDPVQELAFTAKYAACLSFDEGYVALSAACVTGIRERRDPKTRSRLEDELAEIIRSEVTKEIDLEILRKLSSPKS